MNTNTHKKIRTRKPRLSRWSMIGVFLMAIMSSIPVTAQTTIDGVGIYASPGDLVSDQYKVRVRPVSDLRGWRNVTAIQTKVPTTPSAEAVADRKYYKNLIGMSHSYVNFEMTVPVRVEVSRVNGSISPQGATTKVYPARKASDFDYANGKFYFTLENPANVAVDVEGIVASSDTTKYSTNPIQTISIHGNPPLEGKPTKRAAGVYYLESGDAPPAADGDWDTLYFGRGVHNLGLEFKVYPDKTYYIPGDAIVYATFNNDDLPSRADNVRFFGHGTISGAKFEHWDLPQFGETHFERYMLSDRNKTISLRDCKHAKVEGLTIADSSNHGIKLHNPRYEEGNTSVVSWVKIFGWRVNSDGGGVSDNSDINNCFYRTQDDGLYAGGKSISEIVMWTDGHGNNLRLSFLPDASDHPLRVGEVDVIFKRTLDWSKAAAIRLPLALEPGPRFQGLKGPGVVFSNIHMTDPIPTVPLIDIRQGPLGSLEGVRFENMSMNIINNQNNRLNPSPKNVLSAEGGGKISDLVFHNLKIGGTLVTNQNWLDYFEVSGDVTNITFTSGSDSGSSALNRSGWVASASSSASAYPVSNSLDGNVGTRSRWSTGARQADGQYYQVDMGSRQTFSKIELDSRASARDYPRGYEVNVSNNGVNWGNPIATGAGSEGLTAINFPSQTARYIRVTQTGTSNLWWSIHEFNVFGAAETNAGTWESADVGPVAVRGNANLAGSAWTIAGSGADIWGSTDGFHFVSQDSSGDCSLVARVSSLTNTHAWARAGVMIRESNQPGAKNALMCVTPKRGVVFQSRNASDGRTKSAKVSGKTAPTWLKITRSGDSFTGYYSDDGVNWIKVGSSVTIDMNNNASMGLVVCSHTSSNERSTAVIDQVTAAP